VTRRHCGSSLVSDSATVLRHRPRSVSPRSAAFHAKRHSGRQSAELSYRSGADDERPILLEAIERIERGELAGIVVYRLDRFTRSLASSVKLLERIEAAGGEVISATEPVNGSDGGNLMRNIIFSDRGYVAWTPRRQTKALLGQILSIFEEYEDHLPLTGRQVLYRMMGQFGHPKQIENRVYYCPGPRPAGQGDPVRLGPRRQHRYVLVAVVRRELWCEAAGMGPQLDAVADASEPGPAPKKTRCLLPQPGGFEGFGLAREDAPPDDLAVTQLQRAP
jgi:hypothetical protein